jgi:catechol 2,3-dioxygenase-like lactoylglutathione lyase family enzyme
MASAAPVHNGAAEEEIRMLANARPIAMIITRDRNTAEAFYGETMGLNRLPDDPFAAIFDLGGATMRLTEVPDHVAGPHPVLGWQVEDIEATVDALAAKGVAMTIYEGMGQDARGIWTSPGGGAKVAFFNDPDGNGLSLTQG